MTAKLIKCRTSDSIFQVLTHSMKAQYLFLFAFLIGSRFAFAQSQIAENEDVAIRRNFAQLPAVVTVDAETENTAACGGTLIAEHVVLTAGQCVYVNNGTPRLPLVTLDVLNAQRTNRAPETRSTLKAVVHPKFSGDPAGGYDLALLRLDNSTAPLAVVDIATEKPEIGTRLVTIGSAGLAIRIRRAVVVDPDECETANQRFDRDSMICISEEVPCKGDEGGPVLNEETEELVSVVSVTSDCNEGNRPGLLTLHRAEIAEWIQSVVNQMENAAMPESSPRITLFGDEHVHVEQPSPEPETETDLDDTTTLDSLDGL